MRDVTYGPNNEEIDMETTSGANIFVEIHRLMSESKQLKACCRIEEQRKALLIDEENRTSLNFL